MLKRLCEDKRVETRVAEAMREHAICLDDLPDSFSPECATYRAELGASLPVIGMDLYGFVPLWATHTEEDEPEAEVKTENEKNVAGPSSSGVHNSIFTSANCNLVRCLSQALAYVTCTQVEPPIGNNQSGHPVSETRS
jgi:hypothetical protein